jgi:hypothetical protein
MKKNKTPLLHVLPMRWGFEKDRGNAFSYVKAHHTHTRQDLYISLEETREMGSIMGVLRLALLLSLEYEMSREKKKDTLFFLERPPAD